MAIDIRAIKIILDTNIPGKQPVPFTKSMLYNPVLKQMDGEYPYFTADVEFPEYYLSTLSYEKQVEFFFNKATMLKVLKGNTPQVAAVSQDSIQSQSDVKAEVETQAKTASEIKEIQSKYEPQYSVITTKKDNGLKSLKDAYDAKLASLETTIISDLQKGVYTKSGKQYVYAGKPLVINGIPIDSIERYFNEKKSENVKRKKTLDDFARIDVNKELDIIFESSAGGKRHDKVICTGAVYKGGNSQVITRWYNFLQTIPNESIKRLAPMVPLPSSTVNICQFQKDVETYLQSGVAKETAAIEKEKADIEQKESELKQQLNAEKAKYEADKAVIDSNYDTDREKIYELEKAEIDEKNKTTTSEETTIKESEQRKKELRKKNSETNIMILLRSLFPTKYPIIGNTLSSFSQLIVEQLNTSFRFSDFLPTFLKDRLYEGGTSYSYLKLDGKVYTITQTIWLNDIYNQKYFKELNEKFELLKQWKQSAKISLTLEMDKKRMQFKTNYNTSAYRITDETLDAMMQSATENAANFTRYVKITPAAYLKYAEQLKQTVKDFFNLLASSNDFGRIFEKAKHMKELFDQIEKTMPLRFANESQFRTTISDINSSMKEIQRYEHVLNKYINAPGINMDYKTDSPENTKLLDAKYTNFAESIRAFRSSYDSTNYLLQETINDFLENTEEYKGLFSFIMNPLNIRRDPYASFTDMTGRIAELKTILHQRKHTGVTILNSPQGNEPVYEIYVQMNVIGGELNDDNKNVIDCMYQGETLGDRLEKIVKQSLQSTWTLDYTRIFFDITQGVAKEEIDKQRAKDAEKNGPVPVPVTVPIGTTGTTGTNPKLQGGAITRKYRERLLKTRKLYY
jgi:hypothetical protein